MTSATYMNMHVRLIYWFRWSRFEWVILFHNNWVSCRGILCVCVCVCGGGGGGEDNKHYINQ